MSNFSTLCILGSQPKLGLAELESVFGSENVLPWGKHSALVELNADNINISKLGGTIRVCKVLTKLPNDMAKIKEHLEETVGAHVGYLQDGKLSVGVSGFDVGWDPKGSSELAISVKKTAKAAGKSTRTVPNKTVALNSAQVIHNKLTGAKGWELVFAGNGKSVVMAQTVAIQNIEAYAARDQARPKRDAKVGMLPPKLAQIIINLAVGHSIKQKITIFDAFCGSGVILQEALLMGYNAIGSDIDERMVQFSKINIDWLELTHKISGQLAGITKADATAHQWNFDDKLNLIVASEVFLGKPLLSQPDSNELQTIMNQSNEIVFKFLTNLFPQLKPGTRLCLAVPTWRLKNGLKRLTIIDSLEEIGYNRLSFVHVSTDELIYMRADQLVGRELVVIIRK